MCGIAGIIGSRASVEIARGMAQRLRHRGPDGEGVWSEPGVALAHRRLAILDLSEGGHQPMVFGSQVLTYNGEIYNHERLRADLPGPWRSTGDTEVLVRLLAQHGSACLDRLVGMFAFAVWDTAAASDCCSRAIGWASSPCTTGCCRTALRSPRSSRRCLLLGTAGDRSERGARLFISRLHSRAQDHLSRHLRSCRPGTRSRGRRAASASSATGIRRRRSSRAAPATPCEELDGCCARWCRRTPCRTCRSACFLSGGIDSALTAYYLDAPHTYTLGFDGGGALGSGRGAQGGRALATKHLEMTAPQADFAGALDEMPALFDEPFGDSAAWSNYLIAQFARREVTVALSGEGGDEIFCGYPRYWSRIGARSNFFNRLLARCLPPLSRLASSMQRHAYVGLAGLCRGAWAA